MQKGKLFLIPSYLSSDNDRSFIAPQAVEIIKNVDLFLVENVRSARRFISSLKAGITIEDLEFEVLNKKTSWDELYLWFEPVLSGRDIGVISEAGLPCLADPGNLAVSLAHQTGIQVIPLPGASSIQMALIASGFNGQQFTFHGYLPIGGGERIKKVKELEKQASKGYTQLFMETPYRNEQLLRDIIANCRSDTHLSIACNISGNNEFIRTFPISKWKNTPVQIHKLPTIFSFGQLA
ncbi:MAG: SAM-dependent methyltransferase [Bacteroidota bacterium]